MMSYLHEPVARRAQPWLGTLVSVEVGGIAPDRAQPVIDAAFREIAIVHQCMSFHERESDVSRLNRGAAHHPVAVHPYTFEVLRCALELSALSEGCFDISIGAELVHWGMLPRPAETGPELPGSWRDIELHEDGRVRFHRPLWIDVGGIAKGFAVDRAIECLRENGAEDATVNAGGDLRVSGSKFQRIALELENVSESLPVLQLMDGSVASSSGHRNGRWCGGTFRGPHVHGRRRRVPGPANRFVCVAAERCMIADALTKVVMAEGAASRPLLHHFGASAHVHDASTGWQHIEKGTVEQ